MTGPVAEGVSGSFRDPAGFVFRRDGVLYRQVNEVHRANFDMLSTSGLNERLLAEGLLIPHEQVEVQPAAPGACAVIRPDEIGFVSYPYEWSFSQLKDAALSTLRIQLLALEHGMSLRDASAYNIQFHHGRPVLIDTLSFEALPEGRPWVAYRQFCQHFLAPLALMSSRDVRLGAMLREHLDGVPLDLASELLPTRVRARPSIQLHVVQHAKSQRRHETDSGPMKPPRPFSRQAFRGVLDSLRKGVEGFSLPGGASAWRGYYEEATHYSAEAASRKEELVASFLDQVRPAKVWDLGANTGRFSRLATGRGIETVAFDVDPFVVDAAYNQAKADGETRMLPLVLDLTNPSPAIGWANAERMTLGERGPVDLALALALVHHLAIANNVPLPMVATFLASICRSLVIEFVPKQDEKVQHLLRTREDVFPDYTVDGFERAMGERFETIRREAIEGSARTLYLMRRR